MLMNEHSCLTQTHRPRFPSSNSSKDLAANMSRKSSLPPDQRHPNTYWPALGAFSGILAWLSVGVAIPITPHISVAQESNGAQHSQSETRPENRHATPVPPAVAEKKIRNFAAEWFPPVKVSLTKHSQVLAVDAVSPTWTPDGKQMLYRIQRDLVIAVMDLETKAVRRLVRASDLKAKPGEESTVVGQRVSADGKTVVFARRPSVNGRKNHLAEELWVIPLKGGQPKFVIEGSHPSFGSDPNLVYFHDRKRRQFCSIRLDEKDAKPTDLFACTAYYPVVSPDGTKVVHSERNTMVIREIPSGKIVAQPQLTLEDVGGIIPTWSPDSQKVCTSCYSSKGYLGVWVHDLPSQQTTLLSVEPISQIAWSPDGKQLAFTMNGRRLELHLWNLDSP